MSEYIIQDTTLKNIANAVREKTGKSGNILVSNLASEIRNIPSGGSGDNKFASLVDKTITEVTAEDLMGITSIAGYVFRNCGKLKSITIPSSITSIGDYAFNGCYGLTSITFGENSQLTSMGNEVFYYCSSLTSIEIPNGVISIKQRAFYNCSSLTSVTMPSNVESIGGEVFSNCYKLNTIIMKSITPPTLAFSSFKNSTLKEIIVPKGTLEAYKSATNWSTYADKMVEAEE